MKSMSSYLKFLSRNKLYTAIEAVGLIVSILFFYFGHKLFYAAGLLLPMGYGQGPGQALNFGTIYMDRAA